MVDAVVKSFEITVNDMKRVSRLLTKALKTGLENEKEAVVKMFVTYVHSLPDGTEEGDFLALDLGGSNFRVMQISLERGGVMKNEPIYIVEKTEINDTTKTSTQEVLFDFIVQCLSDFVKKYNITTKLPLGFTFSFTMDHKSLTSGILVKWTKEFNVKGAIGRDVIEMFQEALDRREVYSYTCTN